MEGISLDAFSRYAEHSSGPRHFCQSRPAFRPDIVGQKEVRGELVDNIILEIGLALGLIAFAIALAHKLGLSNIPFLILIGIAVGPHVPQFGPFDFRFIETDSLISFMGRIGVLFLLFYLGLEANLTRLIEAGCSILSGGAIYVSINFILGFTLGYLSGFPLRESLIIAALYVLILASASPLLAKESERIRDVFMRLFSRFRRKKRTDAEVEDVQI